MTRALAPRPASLPGRPLPDNTQYRFRFQIPSSDGARLYTVAQRKATGVWSCSCPGWIRHRHCKHLRALAPELARLDLRRLPGL